MSKSDNITIIENKIQILIDDKNILSSNHKKIIEELRVHLELMEEIDDRQITKIDIIDHISDSDIVTLEIWLKDFFHITDDELRTDDQKKRFNLELRRAEIINQIIDVDNQFAESNQILKTLDDSREFIGMDEWDPVTLKAYGLIASLERKIRRWIDDKYSKQLAKYWTHDDFIKSLTIQRYDKINLNYNDYVEKSTPESYPLNPIDFVDFSDYENILKSNSGQLSAQTIFFKKQGKLQGNMMTYLSDIRELRNKVMHRPPLSIQQNYELERLYQNIMKIIKNE